MIERKRQGERERKSVRAKQREEGGWCERVFLTAA